MIDSLDYMQINNIRPMSWNPLEVYLELIFLKRTDWKNFLLLFLSTA
jgi:hypothetical protein